ncbi:MAG: hypothetical protein GXY82_09945 [Methanospirillum sp.]|nr:hypothetical protein [Methanospirillum sp.]
MPDDDLFFEIEERPADPARAPPGPAAEPPEPAPEPPEPAREPLEPAPPAADEPPGPAPCEPSAPERPLPPSAALPPLPGVTPRKRRNWRLTLGLAAVAVLLFAAILAVLTFTVAIEDSVGDPAYPFTVSYDVVFPNAERVEIGNISIVAIPSRDNVTLSVDKVRHDIALGERRRISSKHANVTTLTIPLLSFDFTLDAEYRGMLGQDANFALEVRTSDQVPQFVIDRLLPARVKARPA